MKKPTIPKTILTILTLTIITAGCVEQSEEKQNNKIQGEITNTIDGDTYDFTTSQGNEYRVRILGVDTPETFGNNEPRYWGNCQFNQTYLEEWGEKSTVFIRENYEGEEGLMEKRGEDPYQRQRAKLYFNKTSLSRTLLKEGYANTFTARDFPEKESYLDLEEKARENKVGIWENC